MSSLRFYRIGLGVSITLNILLLSGFWAYLHFEGMLSTIDTLVGILD